MSPEWDDRRRPTSRGRGLRARRYGAAVRKRDPNAVVDQFLDELARSLTDWRTLIAGVGAMPARRATMDAFNRAAVAFERFRSDWHIAAIARDASRFAVTRRECLERTLKGGGQGNLLPYAHLVVPAHPTLDQVADLLDATGGNVAIPNIERWKGLASRDLADPWCAKVHGISWPNAKAAAAVITIRNAAAHQSPRSLAAMSAALGDLTHPAHAGLQRPVNSVTLSGIPGYLHGLAGIQRRVERYHELLRVLSEGLRT